MIIIDDPGYNDDIPLRQHQIDSLIKWYRENVIAHCAGNSKVRIWCGAWHQDLLVESIREPDSMVVCNHPKNLVERDDEWHHWYCINCNSDVEIDIDGSYKLRNV